MREIYDKKIENYISEHQAEFLRDLETLVAIDSSNTAAVEGKPYGQGAADALDVFLDMASRYGLYTENLDYYAGIVSFDSYKERKLDILAHLDVVAGGGGWTKTEPFVMKRYGNLVYGRGTADDKGPALAALYAMRAIRELQIPLKDGVRLVAGCDEELGGRDMEYYYETTEYAPMTFSPDADYPLINIEKGFFSGEIRKTFAVEEENYSVLEINGGIADNVVPSECTVKLYIADKENLSELKETAIQTEKKTGTKIELCTFEEYIEIRIFGVSAHASTPELGNNAVTAMLQLLYDLPLKTSKAAESLRKLCNIFPHGDYNGKAAGIYMSDEESGSITVSLNILRFEKGELYAAFDSRTPLCANDENLKPIQTLLRDSGFDCEFDRSEPHHVPKDSEFVQTLLQSYEKITGEKGYCIAMGGGTYVHNVPNGVAFGCAVEGIDNHMHGPDEFADIEVLMQSSRIFADAIIELCGE